MTLGDFALYKTSMVYLLKNGIRYEPFLLNK